MTAAAAACWAALSDAAFVLLEDLELKKLWDKIVVYPKPHENSFNR
jgi:hypothetical protein